MNQIQARILICCGMLFGFHNGFSQSEAQTAKPQESVSCTIVYDNKDGKGGDRLTSDHLRVAIADLGALPPIPPEARKPIGSPFGCSDFHGKLTNRVQTQEGVLIETYEGDFKNAVYDETFVPLGEPINLKPTIWWPQGGEEGAMEHYTTELPAKNLRRTVGPAAHGQRPPQRNSRFPRIGV